HRAVSGVVNEMLLGNDPSHSGYARNIPHMTNVFREHMIQPIVGIDHLIGATSAMELSCMHPWRFTSFGLLNPLLGREAIA
ncbi:hypothetical protein DOTSEDRAFT_123664, partial [Dothistroma septosporum NZE10]